MVTCLEQKFCQSNTGRWANNNLCQMKCWILNNSRKVVTLKWSDGGEVGRYRHWELNRKVVPNDKLEPIVNLLGGERLSGRRGWEDDLRNTGWRSVEEGERWQVVTSHLVIGCLVVTSHHVIGCHVVTSHHVMWWRVIMSCWRLILSSGCFPGCSQ